MLRALAGLGGVVACLVVAAVVVLGGLDRPWIKARLVRLVRQSAGLDVDYRALHVGLSGLSLEDLVVQSPKEFRAAAPEFLRVGRVDARWSLGPLLGPAHDVEHVTVSDVALTMVVDERGTMSSDLLFPPSNSPSTPLSHQAKKLLSPPPPIGGVDVQRVTLALVRIDHAAIVDRTELGGLALSVLVQPAGPRAPAHLVASLGSAPAPLELGLVRSVAGAKAGEARAHFSAALDVSPDTLVALLDLRMLEQTFAANVSADHWLHLEANAHFDPAAGKTQVTLGHLEAGDGAATAEAAMDLPDDGPPTVAHARGDVDLARLLRWMPPGVVPVTAERARLRYEVASLVASSAPALGSGGSATVDLDLANVAASAGSGEPLQVEQAAVSLQARPLEGGGIAGHATAKLSGARLPSGEGGLAVEDAVVDVDGQRAPDGTLAGTAGVRFARIEDRTKTTSVTARDGRLSLGVQALRVDSAAPLATRGDVSVAAAIGVIDARLPEMRVTVDGLDLHAHAPLDGHPPYSAELSAPMAHLRLTGRAGLVLADAPARLEATVRDAQPDPDHPLASRGVLHAEVDLGDVRTSLDATKAADAVDYALRSTAASLKIARPFLPASLADAAPWDAMAVSLRSAGRVERLGGDNPAVRQATQIDVERPGFGEVAARTVSLALKSNGTALQHQADIDLRVAALAFAGGAPSDDHVTLSAAFDREHPSLRFHLATEGLAAVNVSASASFDPARKAIPYEIDGHVGGLAPLAPFAAAARGAGALDLSELEVALSSKGALLGVVAGVARDGTARFEPDPLRTAAVEGTTDVRVTHFRWHQGGTGIATPSLAWHANARIDGARRILESHVEAGTVHLGVGNRVVDVNGIEDEAKAVVHGSLANPEVELEQRLSVRAIEQAGVPEYPMGDIAFGLTAERGPEGVIHLTDLKLVNALGGTSLDVTGNVDLGGDRRRLSVSMTVGQELGRLSILPERFKGQGKLGVEATVTSPDFVHYNVRATVKGEDVSVALPRQGIEVQSASGEVPVTVALEVGAHGVALRHTEKRSPYSMLRFADQHPLLTRSGFLSVARIKTPMIAIAPLVGNLEIEQNVISLRQFEMGIRGGRVTGQCGVDWDGPRSTLELHVRASGVQSSHGEPFDGNIAVAVSVGDRTIDGRAEILRIGERHLLDLLDLQDPLHSDPAINRIRGALAFGYPKSLRLIFDHGFASAHLELGGLAQLVSIGEIRGIPMGPIVDKMLAPSPDAASPENAP